MALLCLILLACTLFTVRVCYRLLRNVQMARATGLRYLVVPFTSYDSLVMGIAKYLVLRPAKWLWPNPSPTSWRCMVSAWWIWTQRHALFNLVGSDTFLLVSPNRIIMYTADADVIDQITTRQADFPKATDNYELVNLYGSNVLTTNGTEWRHHRNAVSLSFSEQNNELVWQETFRQGRTMVASWMGGTDGTSKDVPQLAGDIMRLSLSVISRAALGQRMDWAWGGDYTDIILDQDNSSCHSMSFTESLQRVLRNIFGFAIVPRYILVWFAKIRPSHGLSKAFRAQDELRRYLLEMVATKRATMNGCEKTDVTSMDLLGHLLKGQQQPIGTRHNLGRSSVPLTESEIIGNLFIFFIAGHETSANSIYFSLLLLAIHPDIQRMVQLDLDHIFGGRLSSAWSYQTDFVPLINSSLGAVLNEQLRLIPPVISIPKIAKAKPQTLVVNGDQVTLPVNTIIRIAVHAAHRNPRFWPSTSPSNPDKPYFPPSNLDNDLEEFKPQRWLTPSPAIASLGPTSVPPPLFRPRRGSYMPFSLGERACTGQRFAKVEIMCALALILSEYSVELGVKETDEEIAGMILEEKKAAWCHARDNANKAWQQKMECVLTLQLKSGHIPVRFVKRGSERFAEMEA